MIKIKRVYEDKKRGDGLRVLVDRLWPRGMKKTELSFELFEVLFEVMGNFHFFIKVNRRPTNITLR